MKVLSGSRHLGDDDLIRYMDHQLDREGHRLMGVHLRTCPSCAARLQAVRQRAERASEWLALLPAEMPDPGKRAMALTALERARFRRRPAGVMGSPWLKAAAAIVLLVSVGMATEPVRAFVARGVVRLAGNEPGPVAMRLVEWLGQEKVLETPTLASAPREGYAVQVAHGPEMSAPTPSSSSSQARVARPPRIKPGMSAPVQFDPAGPDVSLVFQSMQELGTATIWIREVAAASAQATRGYHAEPIEPGPDGLLVRNRADSRADYMITVPSRFRFIRVKVGDTPEVQIRIDKSKQEWIWTINLRSTALPD
jgi:hypothetical protein